MAWNPFRGLSPDEQRSIEIRFPREICAVCGVLFKKGERAMPMPPSTRFHVVDGDTKMYQNFNGTHQLKPTYRHLDCRA